MPRALIAGCGYLGRAIADLLRADGWEVEGWTMSPESGRELSVAGYRAHNVDISKSKDVVARKSQFDVVIHSASTRGGAVDAYRSVYLNGARNLLETFGAAQFLFVGSSSVYAQTTGEWVTEESPAEPKHETGKILRETENFVLQSGGIVIRLGGMYGPGRSALLKKFLNDQVVIDPDRFINQIHRDDAATAIRLLMHQSTQNASIVNVVDNEPMLLSECYRWLARKLDLSRLPSSDFGAKRKRGDSNKRVSNAKLRGLGWEPQYPTFADGMEKSVLQNNA